MNWFKEFDFSYDVDPLDSSVLIDFTALPDVSFDAGSLAIAPTETAIASGFDFASASASGSASGMGSASVSGSVSAFVGADGTSGARASISTFGDVTTEVAVAQAGSSDVDINTDIGSDTFVFAPIDGLDVFDLPTFETFSTPEAPDLNIFELPSDLDLSVDLTGFVDFGDTVWM